MQEQSVFCMKRISNQLNEERLALQILLTIFSPYKVDWDEWARQAVQTYAQDKDFLLQLILPFKKFFNNLRFKPTLIPQLDGLMQNCQQQLKQLKKSNKFFIPKSSYGQFCYEFPSLYRRMTYFLKIANQNNPLSQSILLVRRQLSMDECIKCNILLCYAVPDQPQYKADYAECLLYSKQASTALIYAEKNINKCQSQQDYSQSRVLQTTLFVIKSQLCKQLQDRYNLLIPNAPREAAILQVIKDFDLKNLQFAREQIMDFYANFPDPYQLVPCELMLLLDSVPTPEDYQTQFQKFLLLPFEKLPLYNLCMGIKFYNECLFDESAKHFERQMENNDSKREVYLRAATLYYRMGYYSKSLACFYKLKVSIDDNPKVFIWIAAIYIKMGKKFEPRVIIKRIQENRKAYDFKFALASLYSSLYEPDKVMKCFDYFKYGQSSYTDVQKLHIWIILMINYRRKKDKKMAEQTFEKIMKKCLSLKSTYGLFYEHFQIFYFMTEFCYTGDADKWKLGKTIAKMAWDVVEALRKYSIQGAKCLERKLRKRQSCDIELLLI